MNNLPFLTTIPQYITSGTFKEMNDIIKENVLICIGNVMIPYNKRGLETETVLADP